MFVQLNTLQEVKAYFTSELHLTHSRNEIESIVKQITLKRFKINGVEYILFNDKLSESDLLHYHKILKRLKAGEPFQYIINEVDFYGLELLCDSRALIPRPETEELVVWVVDEVSSNKAVKILDLCSGSGCIGLAINSQLPKSEVELLEYSDEALELASENISKTGLNVSVRKIDVLSSAEMSDLQDDFYDCWVSNPPYIPNSEKGLMESNVLDYEPGMALFVEDSSPLVFYHSIAQAARKKLKDGGRLFFEINESFGGDVMSLLSNAGFVNIELRKDLQGRDRMVMAQNVHSYNEPGRGKSQDF